VLSGHGTRTRLWILQVENLRLLPATCGPAKTPPRTAPSWMPPAVRRLRHVLPVTGSFVPGPIVARPGVVRGQVYPDLVAVTFFLTFFLRLRLQALPRFSE